MNENMSHATTTMLPTNNSVPIENVVVAESGEDSDDEWNYIKVDKEKQSEQENKTPIDLDSEQPDKEAASKEQHQEEAIEEDITSPTPPTASIGETDFVSQQSHAIAQAFAEPEEACTELLENKEETGQSELFELDRAERSSSVAAEHDSDLGNEEDLEEMDSQLNPNAEEFVPVSPQRTSVSSPFGNGLTNRFDLDDEVVSQSPRKGSAILMNDNDIVLPAENDFTEISQRPSELTANELKFDIIQCDNGNVTAFTAINVITDAAADAAADVAADAAADADADADDIAIVTVDADELKDVKRPESSSSQCSYQEMNLKEAMHGDEKQELAAEDPELLFTGGDVPITNGGGQQFSEQNPMNMSFYNDENNPFKNSQEVDMNAVQLLPDDVDDEVSQDSEVVDYVSKPVLSNDQNYSEMQELVKEFSAEGEKLNLNAEQQSQQQQQSPFEQPTPITNYVQELATEVTSILNEFEKTNSTSTLTEGQQSMQVDTDLVGQLNKSNEATPDVINESDLSVNAHEFIPTEPVSDMDFDLLRSPGIVEPELYVQSQVQQEFMHFEQTLITTDEPHAESKPLLTEIEAPIAQQSIDPEPQSKPEQPIVEDIISEPIVKAAALATVTAAIAASAVGIAKAASPKAKIAETKKPEVKNKVAATKKPATTTTASRMTATKLAAKPSTTTVPKTTAAPKVASRSIAPKVGIAAVEKKTATSTITRKPLSNGTGVTSTVTKKTTTVSSATKSATGPTRTSGTTLKPATARTSSVTTSAAKTAASKPAGSTTAAPRVPLSARTVSKPATGTTSKVTATKTSMVSSTTRVKSAPVTTTARLTTLTKPKTSLTADKLSVTKSTASKVSPTKTSTLSTVKSPAARLSLLSASTVSKTTPTRKPLSTASKTPTGKSPRVPTTNGVASKTKVVAKSGVGAVATAPIAATAADKEKLVTTNGDSKLNGHIGENGTGAEKIIDVSAD